MLPFELLGFVTLGCGCLVGRYRQPALDRDVDIVEDKGCSCACLEHRRNEPLAA